MVLKSRFGGSRDGIENLCVKLVHSSDRLAEKINTARGLAHNTDGQ